MKLTEISVGVDELEEIRLVFDSGYLTQGAKTNEFEGLVSAYTGTKFGHATSSATTGLHLALHVLGVGPGDEVIVPAFSFPATANVVVQLGAKPVFADIALSTFNLDVAGLERYISKHTKVIMPVHAFGLCAEMDQIGRIAERYSIDVVEDAACALGARFNGVSAGKLGRMGVFSFHPRKIITTGEGGMIVTDDDEISKKLSILRSHGSTRLEQFLRFEECGFNYRLSDVNSAIGVVQMRKLSSILKGRRIAAQKYSEILKDIAEVRTPHEPQGQEHSYQSYVILLANSVDRDQVIRNLRMSGIETTLGTYGLHLQPSFLKRFDYEVSDFSNSTFAHNQCLTIPLGHSLSDSDLEFVHSELSRAVGLSRRNSTWEWPGE